MLNPAAVRLNRVVYEAYLGTRKIRAPAGGRYVRFSLEAGGIETRTALNNLELTDAYKYEQFLPSKGFSKIGENTLQSYSPMKGDIMVFGNTSNHIHGHIQMYNGSNWVSDFVQRTPYPWRDYGNYSIFRW